MRMKKLGRNWKPLQRSAYAAAVLTLLHWMFIHNNFVPALAHFAPLVVLAINRVVRNLMHVGRAAQCDRSEEHTSELQSLMRISYAVFCLKKKKIERSEQQLNIPTDNAIKITT